MDGIDYSSCIGDILAWDAIELFIKIELHVSLLEVVALDLDISRKHSALDCECSQPLARPKCVQFVVLGANLNCLIFLAVALSHLKQGSAFLEILFNVLLHFGDQILLKCTRWFADTRLNF